MPLLMIQNSSRSEQLCIRLLVRFAVRGCIYCPDGVWARPCDPAADAAIQAEMCTSCFDAASLVNWRRGNSVLGFLPRQFYRRRCAELFSATERPNQRT